MKELISAELYNLRKSKLVIGILIGAVIAGMLMPAFFYIIIKMLDVMTQNPEIVDFEEFQMMIGTVQELMNGTNIFMMLLPMAEGYGLIIVGVLCYYVSSQFSNGIIRNKIIMGFDRSKIYISMAIGGLIISIPATIIYTLVSYGMTSLCFGAIDITTDKLLSILCVVIFAYIAYAGILTFTSYMTKKTAVALMTGILIPIIMNAVFSLIGIVIKNFPEELQAMFAVLPSCQFVLIGNNIITSAVIIISVIADIAWLALTTLFGILMFKKADIK